MRTLEVVDLINELFETTVILTVPIYQREYQWTLKECETLYNDVVNAGCKNTVHFLGTMHFKRIDKDLHDKNGCSTYIIIDGQQRLTTIYLILLALYYHEKEKSGTKPGKDERLLKKLKNSLHTITINGEICTLSLRAKDNYILTKLINKAFNEEVVEEIELGQVENKDNKKFNGKEKLKEFTAEERAEEIYKNFVWIYTQLEGVQIGNFYNKLEKLKVAPIELNEKFDEQEVFESLNTTGLKLTTSDKVRNYLFMPLNLQEQEDAHRRYWEPMEGRLGKDHFETFLQMYAMYVLLDDDIRKAQTYTELKKYYNKNSIEDRFGHLEKFSKWYSSYVGKYSLNKKNKEYTNIENIAVIFGKYINWRPGVLLYFYFLEQLEKGKIKETDVCEYMEIFLNYCIRAIFKKGNNVLHAQYVIALLKELEGSEFNNKEWKAIILRHIWGFPGNYAYPSDEELDCFDISTGFNSSRAEAVLYLLEDNDEITDISNITLEHIMPQEVGEWKDELKKIKNNTQEEYLRHIKRLGNMALLSSTNNRVCSNSKFSKKKDTYKESSFKTTREVCTYTEWDYETIDERTNELLKLVKDRFKELDRIKLPERPVDWDAIGSKQWKEITIRCGNIWIKPIESYQNLYLNVLEYLINELSFSVISEEASELIDTTIIKKSKSYMTINNTVYAIPKNIINKKKVGSEFIRNLLIKFNRLDDIVVVNDGWE